MVKMSYTGMMGFRLISASEYLTATLPRTVWQSLQGIFAYVIDTLTPWSLFTLKTDPQLGFTACSCWVICVCVSALEEPEAKEKYMRQLMMQLPEPNYSTAMFILDHLIKYVLTVVAADLS